jgi:hypothetical protein
MSFDSKRWQDIEDIPRFGSTHVITIDKGIHHSTIHFNHEGSCNGNNPRIIPLRGRKCGVERSDNILHFIGNITGLRVFAAIVGQHRKYQSNLFDNFLINLDSIG